MQALVSISSGASGNVDLSAVAQSIVPAANITYDLGDTANRWRDIYLANSTIYLGEAEISASGGNLILPATVQIGDAVLDASSGNLALPENISAVTVTASGNITAGNVSATNITGTIATASQPNITSVGTLGSLSVTGNVSGGNLITNGILAISGIATKQIIAVHTASNTTVYTRTATTDAAFGADLTITPVSASSRFLVFARMSGLAQQTGGDNDARGFLDACARNSDGSYTSFAANATQQVGILNAGTDPVGYADITAIADTNARFGGNLNIRHFGRAQTDATSGQITTLAAHYLQVIAVEYI